MSIPATTPLTDRNASFTTAESQSGDWRSRGVEVLTQRAEEARSQAEASKSEAVICMVIAVAMSVTTVALAVWLGPLLAAAAENPAMAIGGLIIVPGVVSVLCMGVTAALKFDLRRQALEAAERIDRLLERIQSGEITEE